MPIWQENSTFTPEIERFIIQQSFVHGSGDETASLAHILFHSVFNTLDYANK